MFNLIRMKTPRLNKIESARKRKLDFNSASSSSSSSYSTPIPLLPLDLTAPSLTDEIDSEATLTASDIDMDIESPDKPSADQFEMSVTESLLNMAVSPAYADPFKMAAAESLLDLEMDQFRVAQQYMNRFI